MPPKGYRQLNREVKRKFNELKNVNLGKELYKTLRPDFSKSNNGVNITTSSRSINNNQLSTENDDELSVNDYCIYEDNATINDFALKLVSDHDNFEDQANLNEFTAQTSDVILLNICIYIYFIYLLSIYL